MLGAARPLRILVLKELGVSVGPYLFAKCDETSSYECHINKLSITAPHHLIRRAVAGCEQVRAGPGV